MANIKAPENKKDFMIRVRVTTEEHEKFIQKAKENGYKTISAFIRSLIDEQPKTDTTKSAG